MKRLIRKGTILLAMVLGTMTVGMTVFASKVETNKKAEFDFSKIEPIQKVEFSEVDFFQVDMKHDEALTVRAFKDDKEVTTEYTMETSDANAQRFSLPKLTEGLLYEGDNYKLSDGIVGYLEVVITDPETGKIRYRGDKVIGGSEPKEVNYVVLSIYEDTLSVMLKNEEQDVDAEFTVEAVDLNAQITKLVADEFGNYKIPESKIGSTVIRVKDGEGKIIHYQNIGNY